MTMTFTEDETIGTVVADAADTSPARVNRVLTIIEQTSGWRLIDWRELIQYRDLLYFLTWRSIKARYAQSALGVGWAVIQPVFSMLVFTVVFGKLAKVDSDGAPYAIFSFAGLVPWTFFANSLTEATASLPKNANMISKVYFPRLVLPLSSILAKLVDFGIAMLLLAALMCMFGVAPTADVFFLPVCIGVMILTAGGLGMWLTALAIQYRDINYGIGFLVQLLMYCAPVVYPTSLIPEEYQLAYGINPMVGVIEGFRAALLGTREMPWQFLLMGSLTSVLLFVSGAFYFRFKERLFADVA